MCLFFLSAFLCLPFILSVAFIALFGLDVNILFVLLVCLFAFPSVLRIETMGRALARDWMKQRKWVWVPARNFIGLFSCSLFFFVPYTGTCFSLDLFLLYFYVNKKNGSLLREIHAGTMSFQNNKQMRIKDPIVSK